MKKRKHKTASGIEIQALYGPEALLGFDPATELGRPGEFPYTRGVYTSMYRGKLWTMRQYAGFGTAKETNERFKLLLEAGQTGLSCAFDLPTQMGYDSDSPLAMGEVGRVGVAIDSLLDMRDLMNEIPMDVVSTSMTINATAAVLLLLYQIVAEEKGYDSTKLSGTVQNDILKEYVARGTYIYPPRQSMRLATDIFEYCQRHMPAWNTISISGYHIREAGSTAVQEIAFTIANAIEYVKAAVETGMDVDDFAPRISFFWNAHSNLFEEVAKYRAARRIWARVMSEQFHAKNSKSMLMRFHAQTAGSTLTAQQPEVNIVRVALQGLSAILGGTQSLHTNSFDEALGLPTNRSAKLALRTQQVLGYESGITDTADPLAGSYFVESLTNEVEQRTLEYLEVIEKMGGAVQAIENGFMQQAIERSAYEYAREIDAQEQIVVGVNAFLDGESDTFEVFPINEQVELGQRERTQKLREQRNNQEVEVKLTKLREVAIDGGNLLYPMKDALTAYATLGEVSDVLREVFGTFSPRR